MINVMFPYPKDPQDDAWYLIQINEPVTSVSSVICEPTSPPRVPLPGVWRTPGDELSGSPLTVKDFRVSGDGLGVAVRLSGGIPGWFYAVRATLTLSDGSTLHESVILPVAGK